MKYEPNRKSVRKHKVPNWFHDAKFGIFIHWGIYSVPAFAITGIDMVESEKQGSDLHFNGGPG